MAGYVVKMPPKRKRKVDSQQNASDVGKTKRTRPTTPANLTEQPSESITLSLNENNNEASQEILVVGDSIVFWAGRYCRGRKKFNLNLQADLNIKWQGRRGMRWF